MSVYFWSLFLVSCPDLEYIINELFYILFGGCLRIGKVKDLASYICPQIYYHIGGEPQSHKATHGAPHFGCGHYFLIVHLTPSH